jgi:hypothetical protein
MLLDVTDDFDDAERFDLDETYTIHLRTPS